MDGRTILAVAFLFCALFSLIDQIRRGNSFIDWVWPINAALWCLNSLVK